MLLDVYGLAVADNVVVAPSVAVVVVIITFVAEDRNVVFFNIFHVLKHFFFMFLDRNGKSFKYFLKLIIKSRLIFFKLKN